MQNLETLAPGNINCEVFHMSLLEHDHKEGANVRDVQDIQDIQNERDV